MIAGTPPTRPKGYLPTLDGWRAIAIVMVIIAHGTGVLLRFFRLDPEAGGPIPVYGAMGVDIFFGISGFLICSRLIEERRLKGSISLRSFYIRRAFRIFPAYFAVLGFLALMSASGLFHVGRWELLSGVFFFANYLPPSLGGWYTGHFWSLAVEEHFYLLWPSVMFLSPPRLALRLALGGALWIGLWRTAASHIPGLIAAGPSAGFFGRTDIRLDALLFGCLFALLVDQYRETVQKYATTGVTVGLAMLFVGCIVGKPYFAMTWQGILIAAIIASTVLNPMGMISRILEWPALTVIGRLSYSLYLWQQIFLPPLGRRALPLIQDFPLCLAAIAACALLSYYLIERPFIKWGHRLAKPVTGGRVEMTGASAPPDPVPDSFRLARGKVTS